MNAICTVASFNVLPELKLLIKSIRLFIGNIPVIVMATDPHTGIAEAMDDDFVSVLQNNKKFDLDVVGHDKASVIRYGIKTHGSVLYCDCDVMFVGAIAASGNPHHFGLTLSRHHIATEWGNRVGHFNSGYIGCAIEEFCDWWPNALKDKNRYGDQQCLDDWGSKIETKAFSEQHNIGWWREEEHRNNRGRFELNSDNDKIIYNGAPAVSVHTHILRCPGYTPNNIPFAKQFNRVLYRALHTSTDPRHRVLMDIIGAPYL